jgi:hypothetical protein
VAGRGSGEARRAASPSAAAAPPHTEELGPSARAEMRRPPPLARLGEITVSAPAVPARSRPPGQFISVRGAQHLTACAAPPPDRPGPSPVSACHRSRRPGRGAGANARWLRWVSGPWTPALGSWRRSGGGRIDGGVRRAGGRTESARASSGPRRAPAIIDPRVAAWARTAGRTSAEAGQAARVGPVPELAEPTARSRSSARGPSPDPGGPRRGSRPPGLHTEGGAHHLRDRARDRMRSRSPAPWRSWPPASPASCTSTPGGRRHHLQLRRTDHNNRVLSPRLAHRCPPPERQPRRPRVPWLSGRRLLREPAARTDRGRFVTWMTRASRPLPAPRSSAAARLPFTRRCRGGCRRPSPPVHPTGAVAVPPPPPLTRRCRSGAAARRPRSPPVPHGAAAARPPLTRPVAAVLPPAAPLTRRCRGGAAGDSTPSACRPGRVHIRPPLPTPPAPPLGEREVPRRDGARSAAAGGEIVQRRTQLIEHARAGHVVEGGVAAHTLARSCSRRPRAPGRPSSGRGAGHPRGRGRIGVGQQLGIARSRQAARSACGSVRRSPVPSAPPPTRGPPRPHARPPR